MKCRNKHEEDIQLNLEREMGNENLARKCQPFFLFLFYIFILYEDVRDGGGAAKWDGKSNTARERKFAENNNCAMLSGLMAA